MGKALLIEVVGEAMYTFLVKTCPFTGCNVSMLLLAFYTSAAAGFRLCASISPIHVPFTAVSQLTLPCSPHTLLIAVILLYIVVIKCVLPQKRESIWVHSSL